MPQSKKVVLFIVEGICDKICLESILKQMNEDNALLFLVMNGDVTSDKHTTPSNVLKKLQEEIARNRKEIKKKDYVRIVHLFDVDGVFIPEDSVVETSVPKPIYRLDCIEANERSKIIDRNNRKSAILLRLATSERIWVDIPYEAYFFSCNLDHVLHNDANLPNEEKVEKAEEFERRYEKDIDAFVRLLDMVSTPHGVDYRKSWDFISEGLNSLNRYTNFSLYIRKLYSNG